MFLDPGAIPTAAADHGYQRTQRRHRKREYARSISTISPSAGSSVTRSPPAARIHQPDVEPDHVDGDVHRRRPQRRPPHGQPSTQTIPRRPPMSSSTARSARRTKKVLASRLAPPSAATGCTACQACPHFGKGRSPLARRYLEGNRPRLEAALLRRSVCGLRWSEPSPVHSTPRARRFRRGPASGDGSRSICSRDGGARRQSAAALTSETKIQVGDGWFERPIIWIALIGDPSTMKSPIIDKVIKPLRKIDDDRDAAWRVQKPFGSSTKLPASNPGHIRQDLPAASSKTQQPRRLRRYCRATPPDP